MRRLIIAGGGIGGLTAALCLARRNWSVLVLEQADEFTTAGAGIQLSPNCSRVLHDLDLEQPLQAQAFLPEGSQFRRWRDGRVITESTLGAEVEQRYGAPYYHMHRGDLLEVLLQAARNHANIELRNGAEVMGFNQQDDGAVQVQVEGGQELAAGLIGADGIHSRVRESLWGNQEPAFTGNVAWRMLVPTSKLPTGMVRPMSTVWWGPGKHFVHYYVRGGDYVNCVCVVEKSGWQVESWTELGDISELRQDFAGWHPDVEELINQADTAQLYKWAVFDRPPMPKWGKGCVTLLGDACHPTLPFMAQGAAMAIEDAAVLAGCLAQDQSVVNAMQRYEDLRRQRTARIQLGSRRNARVFHLAGIPAWLRNLAAGRARRNSMDELFRYDPLSVADSD
ncbi:MAG: NAD(P)-binding protein [Proteobacteria bacterium]|nr:NAD(P)-binding protein [Pseudomonadota bacterium]